MDILKYGKLYGIGVGPGDPDLITVKAVKTLHCVDVVYTAASTKNNYSLAQDIALPHLKEGTPVEKLDFPMTKDRNILEAVWKQNAEKIMATLKDGKDAAVLTLGDPMTYSTFGYIMKIVKEIKPEIEICIIPGITSFQAAAAASKQVLAEGDESFTVISGAAGSKKITEVINNNACVVILKVYRNYKEIINNLKQLDMISKSMLISRCGLKDEVVLEDIGKYQDEIPSYFSLLLVKNANAGMRTGKEQEL
ncbi:precorrin-2 C(20)-methyltransferase [Desulfobacterium sp. N47]